MHNHRYINKWPTKELIVMADAERNLLFIGLVFCA